MGKIQRTIRKLRDNWKKNLIIAVVVFVALIIVSEATTYSEVALILFIVSGIFAVLGVIGLIAWLLNKLASGLTGGAKKSTSNASKSYGNKNTKKDDVVTLISANGEPIDFVEIAGIAYRGNFYAILQPVKLLEGMSDDEALVFRVSRGADGSDKFDIELDDSIVNAVFREYDKLYAQAHR